MVRYGCVSPIFLGSKNLRIGDNFRLVVPEESDRYFWVKDWKPDRMFNLQISMFCIEK